MRAIDTNVLVRFLTGDDPRQSDAARAIIAAGDVFISSTVCLETAWVLRSSYRYPSDQVAEALLAIVETAGVQVEDRQHVTTAIAWVREGMDFADALHLAKAHGCECFFSFDRKLADAASRLSETPVRYP